MPFPPFANEKTEVGYAMVFLNLGASFSNIPMGIPSGVGVNLNPVDCLHAKRVGICVLRVSYQQVASIFVFVEIC